MSNTPDTPSDTRQVPVALLSLTARVLHSVVRAWERKPDDPERIREVMKIVSDTADDIERMSK